MIRVENACAVVHAPHQFLRPADPAAARAVIGRAAGQRCTRIGGIGLQQGPVGVGIPPPLVAPGGGDGVVAVGRFDVTLVPAEVVGRAVQGFRHILVHGENDLAAAFVRRTENIGIRGLEQGVRQAEFPERLLGHRQVSLAPGLHTVHPQGIVGLQHRHGGRRGHGLVRRIGDVPFRVGNVAFHAHQHFRDGGASEEQLRVGRFVAPERQRGIAPDACDLEEAVRADEVGVPQTKGPRFLLQPHRRNMPDDQVCLVDRRVERRPVGILVDRAHGAGAHLRLVDAVERVVRPRAPQPVAQLAPAEVDVVHALERTAQVDVQPVGGRRGVALLFPHVAGR